MALDFLFAKPEQTAWDALQQGDVLERTPELADALSGAHAYYAEAPDYTHFMVLTQSCDLARRGKQPPRTRYITLAAGRPLDLYIQRLVENNKHSLKLPIKILKKRHERFVRQSLERLLHNTEDGFFFLRAGSHPNIGKDVCIFLPLSIALRVEHYQICCSAKVAQLDHVFQAKVGWLTGNIYSRVGTPDLEEREASPDEVKTEFFEDVLFNESAWLTDAQWKRLQKLIEAWQGENGGEFIARDDLVDLIKNLPNSVQMVTERAVDVLLKEGLLIDAPDVVQRAVNILSNDRPLRKLIKQAEL